MPEEAALRRVSQSLLRLKEASESDLGTSMLVRQRSESTNVDHANVVQRGRKRETVRIAKKQLGRISTHMFSA